MSTVMFEVCDTDAVTRRALNAFKGVPQASHISFESVELMFRVLTDKRWQLIKAMAGAGPMSIREAARRVKRDVKGVHGDVTALLKAGALWKTDDGKIEFPFDEIRIAAVVKAA